MGDRGDVDDANAFSDLLRCPKSPSQCLIVRCRPSDGRASPSVVEGSGNRKRPMLKARLKNSSCAARAGLTDCRLTPRVKKDLQSHTACRRFKYWW